MSRFSPPQGSNGSTGTAMAADVLTGFTFSNSQQAGQSGNMPNNGAVTLTPSGTGTVAVPAGYHNGAGVVSQVSVPAANVLSGTTIAGVAGTMVENGAQTFHPTTTDITGWAGHFSSLTVKGDANLTAGNIKNGVSIFGVTGNATVRAYASGTASNSTGRMTVTGLAFQPQTIVFYDVTTGWGTLDAAGGGLYSAHFDTANQLQWRSTTMGSIGMVADALSVTSSGFVLAGYSGVTYNWEAWG